MGGLLEGNETVNKVHVLAEFMNNAVELPLQDYLRITMNIECDERTYWEDGRLYTTHEDGRVAIVAESISDALCFVVPNELERLGRQI
ncbi:hypothetical protein MHB54_04315 [Paenibacillus sp. FSL M7-0802]|uniref:hypothetical protein n=1 Tax=Paenibacillus sp. FSL M7-0802 TaxID=2921536 RepID=UPI0030F886A2